MDKTTTLETVLLFVEYLVQYESNTDIVPIGMVCTPVYGTGVLSASVLEVCRFLLVFLIKNSTIVRVLIVIQYISYLNIWVKYTHIFVEEQSGLLGWGRISN